MKIPPRRIIFATLFALLIPSLGRAAVEFSERSVSPSGQFVIYGADPTYRGAVSALAERIKADFLPVLKRRDAWKIAIVINLQPRAVNLPEAPLAELRFSRTETGVKLQLNLTVSPLMSSTVIERQLGRVIVMEMIYRNQTGVMPGDVYVEPPAWLVDGLLASAPNQNGAPSATELPAPARALSLTEFLNQRPETLDSAAQQLYGAYSLILVRMLIESPGGRSRLGSYIDNLAYASNDPIADLRVSFPEVRDLERAWKSKVADIKSAPDKGLLTFSRTEVKLNKILEAKFPSRDGHTRAFSLEELSRTKPSPVQRLALQRFSQELLPLGAHANPVLRPVIEDYQQIADRLALGKNRGIEKRLSGLKSLRTRLSVRMNEIDDYMNWFEAAKLETPSGMFDDYLKATGAIDSQRAKRKDPLSVYLDAMELAF